MQPLQSESFATIGVNWSMGPRVPGGIISVPGLDEKPQAITQIAPQYPHELRRASVDGSVVVSCVVNQEGRVRSVEVEESTHNAFSTAALKAVRRWKFAPRTSGGRPVSFRMSIPVVFALTDT